nr:uncharacterized protein LOC105843327 isoform X4 [Hydra vulgaris]
MEDPNSLLLSNENHTFNYDLNGIYDHLHKKEFNLPRDGRLHNVQYTYLTDGRLHNEQYTYPTDVYFYNPNCVSPTCKKHKSTGSLGSTDSIESAESANEVVDFFSQNIAERIDKPSKELTDSYASDCSTESVVSAIEHSDCSYAFCILNKEFPDVFYKKQVRLKNQSKQRIDNGNVSFFLNFGSAKARKSIESITIKVKRKHCEQPKDVIIKHSRQYPDKPNQVLITLDLDSVYEVDNFQVYKLDKSLHDDKKLFYLEVEVKFSNKITKKERTHDFRVAGRKSQKVCPSINNVNILKCKKLVAEFVQTKTLELGEKLRIDNTIQTTNGDIAYHWPLENEDEQFKKGEVVGFIADINGKYSLRKLNLQNCTEAILKGVISRSYYLQAQVPTDGRRSETICMMGIVPVQVKGSVSVNDALYASPDFPGFAVSRYYLNICSLQSSAHIGYAFSTHIAEDDKAVGMVEAGVSVLESARQCLLDVQLRTIKSQIDDISIKQKRTKRYTCFYFIVCITLAVLSSVFLYQIFAPGTSFRYFLCKQGRLSGSAFFQYTPLDDANAYPHVNGIEFEFSVLMQKTAHPGYKQLNITGVRYYLNIDRCAHISIIQSRNVHFTNPLTYGPEVFAVDKKCYHAFYYHESIDYWQQFQSVSWETKQNIYCQPPSIWKNFTLSES